MEEKHKKILFVRTPPYDANFNNYNVQQIGMGKAFCEKGYDFDYITFKKKNQKEWCFYEYNDNKCYVIEKPRFRFFRTSFNKEICKSEYLRKYDLIISQEYYQIMTYFLAKNSSNVVMYSGPYWNLFHLKITSWLYDILFTKRINNLIKIKFVKSQLAKEFLEKKGYSNVYNIGVALDVEKYIGVSITEDVLRLSEFMKKNRCLLYVGTLNRNKNLPFLLNLFESLLKKYPDLKLVLIGKSQQNVFNKISGKYSDSFFYKYLNKHSDLLKSNTIHIRSLPNSQLKFIYPNASVFLLPSIHEIFGMVLLEAMYFKAPVVSSKNGGSVTLIKDDTYGQIINDYSIEQWSMAISKYLNDPEYVNLVTNNSHNLVKNEYNWSYIVDQIIKKCNI